MKAYFYGSPDAGLVKWAFALRKRWPWSRYLLGAPIALLFIVLFPVSWLLVKAGVLGHWLAFKLGFDSRDAWE